MATASDLHIDRKAAMIEQASNPLRVGELVRSYDFQNRDDCYIEGVIVNIGKSTYTIDVGYQLVGGERRLHLVGATVNPPLNGLMGMFGPTNGVVRVKNFV